MQLHAGFTFADLRGVLPYLARLGVTDCYLSPCLQARPGSQHGYDICDHTRLNVQLGGEPEFDALAAEARRLGMGLVVDFVPNHMGIDPKTNRWWWNVLEDGPCSRYARFFDIDWHPIKSELEGKLLLAILGRPYGEALERGELVLAVDEGRLVLRYFDHELPIDPRLAPRVLERNVEALRAELGDEDSALREFLSIAAALRNLPTEPEPDRITEREREKEFARERLARLLERSPPIARHVDDAIAGVNGKPELPASFDDLHDLLEGQSYRLAYWRAASHEINYRRFFDVNDLAALRIEDPAVFEATHARMVRLVREEKITGLRIDHIDGLFDPSGYLSRLHEATGPCYVVVEKILTGNETLREGWLTHGTTGYEFLNDLNGIFVDSRGERPLRRFYERFTKRTAPFPILTYVGKKLIVETSLASELAMLADALNRISEQDRRSRDFTLQSLRDVLIEVTATFPVYRTYVDRSGARDFDLRAIDSAILRARRRNPAMEKSIFAFVRKVLLAEADGFPEAEYFRRLEFAMKFQQYSGPVQAKGLEDTAFYRYNLLVSLNEVGGDPQRFGRSVANFHGANRYRREHWPATMLATSTHDTKRSEDVRARVNVLSELPDEWSRVVSRCSRWNARNRTATEGDKAPDRNDELLFYQSLVGVWPFGATRADATLVERLVRCMGKSAKEAKLHTSWINDDPAYEGALKSFVEKTLTGERTAKFFESFLPFQQRVTRLGMVNSLAQVLLKIVSPGVADFYQGNEVWDLSLVDPDNRRPVDYTSQRHLLDEMESALVDPAARGAAAARLLEQWTDGAIKLYVTTLGLRLRREHPKLFLEGEYVPVPASGARSEHVVAIERSFEDHAVVAIAPRLSSSLTSTEHPWPLGEPSWGDTTVALSDLAGRDLLNIFTGNRFRAAESLLVAELLQAFPVALIVPV